MRKLLKTKLKNTNTMLANKHGQCLQKNEGKGHKE